MTWPTAPLGDLVDITSGFAFKSEQFNDSGDGLPLVRIRDVVGGSSDTYYSGDYKQDFIVENGDALIGMDGEFNLGCWRGGRALLNQRVCKVVAKDERLDQEYLVRFMPSALKSIEAATPFVTVKHLSVKVLRDISVPLPPLPEQRRIAAILDKADALRAKRREAIAKLDQLLQAVFLDMFGDPVMNPKGWPEIAFDEIVESTKLGLVRSAAEFGRTDEFDVPYIRMDAISSNGRLLAEKVQRTRATPEEIRDCSVAYGDMLFNTRNSEELVGKATVVEFSEPWTFNNNLMRVRFNGRANSLYVLRYLLSRRGRTELGHRKSGTTNVFAIYYKDLRSLPVVAPSKSLQDRFATISNQIRARSILCHSQTSEFARLFQSLQSAAFSGGLVT